MGRGDRGGVTFLASDQQNPGRCIPVFEME
jgi:hypothetical protein